MHYQKAEFLTGFRSLEQLCPTRGPVEGFVRPSLGFHCSKSILQYIFTTCPYFENPEFNVFDAGCPQYHFITSVTTAVRIRKLSVY